MNEGMEAERVYAGALAPLPSLEQLLPLFPLHFSNPRGPSKCVPPLHLTTPLKGDAKSIFFTIKI